MPDLRLAARRLVHLLLAATLVAIIALVLVWGWHLLTPEGWHWLNGEQLGDIEAVGICLLAAGGAGFYALTHGMRA